MSFASLGLHFSGNDIKESIPGKTSGACLRQFAGSPSLRFQGGEDFFQRKGSVENFNLSNVFLDPPDQTASSPVLFQLADFGMPVEGVEGSVVSREHLKLVEDTLALIPDKIKQLIRKRGYAAIVSRLPADAFPNWHNAEYNRLKSAGFPTIKGVLTSEERIRASYQCQSWHDRLSMFALMNFVHPAATQEKPIRKIVLPEYHQPIDIHYGDLGQNLRGEPSEVTLIFKPKCRLRDDKNNPYWKGIIEEVGHAFDESLDFFSNTQAFREVLKNDLAVISDEAWDVCFSHLLHGNDKDYGSTIRKELFANLFTEYVSKEKRLDGFDATTHFPACAKLMRELISQYI